MNLSELQAFLEECNWDEDPLPAQVADSLRSLSRKSAEGEAELNFEEIELSSDAGRRSGRLPPVEKPAAPASVSPVAEPVLPETAAATPDPVLPQEPEPAEQTQPAPLALEPLPVAKAPVEPVTAPAPQAPVPPARTGNAAVKLVPKPAPVPVEEEQEERSGRSLQDRLAEVKMAQKMGYLLCKCTWPPQVMVLTGTDHVYRCRRCSRVREM